MSRVEEWRKAIKIAEEAGVDGWAVMNHSLCRGALDEEHERAEAWKACALRLMAKMDEPK